MTRALDAAGISLSALCLVHCLGLPFAAASVPLVVQFTEAEWVHWTIVALAAPAALFAIGPSLALRPRPWAVPLLALAGLAGLVGALFVHTPLMETSLTTLGGIALATAHILNWRNGHRHTLRSSRAS